MLSALASGVFAVETHPATTSGDARADAIRAIPFRNIAPKHRKAVEQVVGDATLYRRMPTCMVDCHPELFTYVTRNPEVLVAMWRELGISRIELKRTGPTTFDLCDGAGTTGKLWLVEQKCDENAQNRLVLFAEGSYEVKGISRPLKAQSVLLLRSGSVKETNDRHYVAARLDTFIRLDRTGIRLLAKAVHPWVGKLADRNFCDTVTFVSNLSRTAELRPESIDRLADKLTQIPADRREHLVRVAWQCADQSATWQTDRGETSPTDRPQIRTTRRPDPVDGAQLD